MAIRCSLVLTLLFCVACGPAFAQIRMEEGGQTAEIKFDGSASQIEFRIGNTLASRIQDLGLLSLIGLGPASTAGLQPGFDTACSGIADEGTIRYNSAITRVQLCNGTGWVDAF